MVVGVSEFELSRSSLEDLFVSKMGNKRVRSLQGICDTSGLDWLWSAGRPVDLSLSPSEYLIEFMKNYYEKVSNEQIVLGCVEDKSIASFPTRCRGSSRYTAELIDKKDNLVDWINEEYDKSSLVFMTFTLSSNRVSDIKEAFDIYREAVNHIISKVSADKHLGRRPTYLWALEPHKSGYPHLHIIFFHTRIPNIEDLAKWWADNYTEGRADTQGVDWEEVKTRQGGSYVGGYVSKYVIKNISFEDLDTEQPEEYLRLFWLGILWFTGRRSWSYSRCLGFVMNYGLVTGWTNSTVWLLEGFNFEQKTWVYIGAFSQVEIDQREEEGTWTFEDLFEEYGLSSQSEDFASSRDLHEEVEVVSKFDMRMLVPSCLVDRMLLALGRMVSQA